jgi:hypothetical protein
LVPPTSSSGSSAEHSGITKRKAGDGGPKTKEETGTKKQRKTHVPTAVYHNCLFSEGCGVKLKTIDGWRELCLASNKNQIPHAAWTVSAQSDLGWSYLAAQLHDETNILKHTWESQDRAICCKLCGISRPRLDLVKRHLYKDGKGCRERSGGLDPSLPKNQPHGFDRPSFGNVPGHEDCVEPEEDEDKKDDGEDKGSDL